MERKELLIKYLEVLSKLETDNEVNSTIKKTIQAINDELKLNQN